MCNLKTSFMFSAAFVLGLEVKLDTQINLLKKSSIVCVPTCILLVENGVPQGTILGSKKWNTRFFKNPRCLSCLIQILFYIIERSVISFIIRYLFDIICDCRLVSVIKTWHNVTAPYRSTSVGLERCSAEARTNACLCNTYVKMSSFFVKTMF